MALLDRIKAKFNFGLGVCYETGKNVGQDYNEAVKYYTLAAEAGYADAQCNLGLCYLQGKGVEKDAAKAIEWFTKSAEQGYYMHSSIWATATQRVRVFRRIMRKPPNGTPRPPDKALPKRRID